MNQETQGDKIRVLLVEDDEDDYLLTRDLFADINPDRYEIEWVNSYEAATSLNKPDCFDICLLDYRLGGYDGLELLKKLRETSYKCPMIMLTGQGDRELDERAMNAGAADYLIKGQITADNLERSVRYAIQQRQLEEQRVNHLLEQEARRQAENANKAKDEFLATLSHELRMPLNVMLGWVQLLRKNGRDDAIFERALDAIERSARTQTQLVEDLLDIARITNDSLQMTMRPVDLGSVIGPAVEGLRPVADARSITIEVSQPASPVIISGDPHRLQQVVNNLLSNAIKFTPEQGLVKVMLENSGAKSTITVTDNGRGIEREFLPQIFQRYTQSSDAKATRKGGLGLGLAIVHKIVKLHGGSITAESDGPGRGATFRVALPTLKG
jgi:signal transduction histidine kinase